MRRPRYKVGDFVVSTYHQNMTLMYVVDTACVKDLHGEKKLDKHLVFCNVLNKNPRHVLDHKLTFECRNEWWELRRATEQEIIEMCKLSQDGSI